ncbi:IclR family transcriptional regulator (plasmid) [Aureimonas ureilytica]|uniref:IclR family transcriptional regulator n=1 Tax=Aureimonas ureilytica TaxID=401562 RepID=UPI003CEFBFEC
MSAAVEAEGIKAKGRARGLDRAFDILDCLAEARRPLRAGEIAALLGAPRSTIYELGALLQARGLLEDAGEGKLFLGERVHLLAAAYAAVSGRHAAIQSALKRIVEETAETAQFCRLDGNQYYVAAQREGSRPFRISTDIGERVPLTWTASGRVLVDHLTPDEILAFVPPGDFALPDGTPIDREAFLTEVAETRARGHFTFDSLLDSYTHCFAVPVSRPDGQAVATLCIVAPREDAKANHAAYLASLKRAAAALSTHFPDQD